MAGAACGSNRHFKKPPSRPFLTGGGQCHVEFQGALEDAQNWFVGSANIKNAFHQMRSPWMVTSVLGTPAVLASENGYTGRTVNQQRVAPDFLFFGRRGGEEEGGGNYSSRCHGPLHALGKC